MPDSCQRMSDKIWAQALNLYQSRLAQATVITTCSELVDPMLATQDGRNTYTRDSERWTQGASNKCAGEYIIEQAVSRDTDVRKCWGFHAVSRTKQNLPPKERKRKAREPHFATQPTPVDDSSQEVGAPVFTS
jgi:hypothetical protein